MISNSLGTHFLIKYTLKIQLAVNFTIQNHHRNDFRECISSENVCHDCWKSFPIWLYIVRFSANWILRMYFIRKCAPRLFEIISIMMLYCEFHRELNFERFFHQKMCTMTVGNHLYYDRFFLWILRRAEFREYLHGSQHFFSAASM